ncbi:MAG: hypothetical protein K2H22_05020, partial [Muribaculaceae bacterium]|nr:hypothetical protein [Muribaculaceae bacterium]
MKKFCTILSLGAALTLSAAPHGSEALRATSLPDFKSVIKEKCSSMKSYPTRSVEAPGEVIYKVDGAAMPMDLVTDGFYVYTDVVYFTDTHSESEFVFGNDGYVYIKDFMSSLPYGSYIRGEVDPDTFEMKFTFPQTIDNDEDYEWVDLNLYYENGFPEDMPVPVEDSKNYITFTYNDDGSISMNPLPEGCFIGATMQPYDMWAGMAQTAAALVEPSDNREIVTIPEGVAGKQYSYITYGYGQFDKDRTPDFGYRVEVAIDGDDVYFKGLSMDDASICFKGKLEGDKIIVPNNQFLGVLASVYETSLTFGHPDANAYGGYALSPEDTVMVLDYDEAKGLIKVADPELVMFFNLTPNSNPNGIYYLQMFENLELIYQPDASGAPKDPWGLSFSEGGSDSALSIFDFNFPLVNADGVLLERENMYYNIFIDGELWPLTPEDFNIPETLENVPYLYKSNQIVSSKINIFHELGFHIQGFDTLGVQCFNVFDGVTYPGKLATLDVATGEVPYSKGESGVDGTSSIEDKASVEYFDL